MGHRAWGIASSSKFKVQGLKYENAPEISQKTLNLEHGTFNLIELPAAICPLLT
jgi:hypothetical protein